MGIIVSMRFDFLLATRSVQTADVEYAGMSAIVLVAIELAGFECDCSGHAGTV